MAGPHLYGVDQCLMLIKDSRLLKGNRGEMEDRSQDGGRGLVCGLLYCDRGLGGALDRCETIHHCAVYPVGSVWGPGGGRLRCLPNALSFGKRKGLDVSK
jgi:hypothetical protein